MNTIQSKTVVFLTGAFVSNSCWDAWRTYFETKGYKTLAPAWPNKDGSAEELRSRHPNVAIASDTLPQLISHYTDIVKQQEEKPIVIGHSLGGLLSQILMDRDLVSAAVAIHSVPPQGVIPTQFSFYKATWRALGLFSSLKKTYLMSFRTWQYAFTNGMSVEEQTRAYDSVAIPESKKALRGALTSAAKVNFKKPHVPLLFVSGSTDHCVPATLNYTNYKRYKDNSSVTDYKEFEGRNHFVLGQPTWREDADYILNWISQN
jgi:pimeloyl-ACP methyl ester carboxylesterase